jgi:hypothetical protein
MLRCSPCAVISARYTAAPESQAVSSAALLVVRAYTQASRSYSKSVARITIRYSVAYYNTIFIFLFVAILFCGVQLEARVYSQVHITPCFYVNSEDTFTDKCLECLTSKRLFLVYLTMLFQWLRLYNVDWRGVNERWFVKDKEGISRGQL